MTTISIMKVTNGDESNHKLVNQLFSKDGINGRSKQHRSWWAGRFPVVGKTIISVVSSNSLPFPFSVSKIYLRRVCLWECGDREEGETQIMETIKIKSIHIALRSRNAKTKWTVVGVAFDFFMINVSTISLLRYQWKIFVFFRFRTIVYHWSFPLTPHTR